jgi:glyoxylase-like metal-dependent hydrolase (beta-lactamase superfamily II)
MADAVRVQVGDIELTRVEYFDVALGPEVVNLSAEQVTALAGAVPSWATAEGQVLIGQAMWVIESAGTTMVVDPCGASDAFLRSGPEAITHQEAMLAALAAAGIEPGSVDLLVLTHLDGIGLAGVVDEAGRWSPAFGDARIVMNHREVDFLASADASGVAGLEAFTQLVDQGAVDAVGDDHDLAPGVRLVHTGGHSVGHAVVHVASGPSRAVLIGHLAVSPLNLTAPIVATAHRDVDVAAEVIDDLLVAAAATGTIVIGPLWPHPGAGRVHPDAIRQVVPLAT